MSVVPYSYSTIKYVHDPAAGEALNIGVLVYSPEAKFVRACVEERYERLSRAFASFDGDHYRRVVRHLQAAVERIRDRWKDALPDLVDVPRDARELGVYLWPDQDLSFRFGVAGVGVSPDLDDEAKYLFERFVTSQSTQARSEKRSDDEVWVDVYKKPLAAQAVQGCLQPKKFAVESFEIEFKNAFKNAAWHLLQPISFDYARAEYLGQKALQWLGKATALESREEIGKLYLLLGKPSRPDHRKAYAGAKDILHRMELEHQIVEEDEAEDFARDLAKYMRDHGVVQQEMAVGQEDEGLTLHP